MRDVVDDLAQILVAQAVGGGADGQVGQLAAERQAQHPGAERQRQQPQRHTREEFADDLELHWGELSPAACRCDTGQCAGAAAALQFEGNPAAERVADDVCGFPAQRVHPAFDVVGQRA